MPRQQTPNLVIELGDTNIGVDPCKLPCLNKHYIVVRPKDYDKRKKILKHGARFVGFTINAKTDADVARAIIADAKRYEFKK